MWAEALGLERVGIHDNFFDLGGHSLMATRLFTRIEAEFERSIPLAILFRAQTIAELADVLTNTPASGLHRSNFAIRNGKLRRPPLFLLHGIDGDLGQWRSLIEHLGTGLDIYGLKLPEKNGVSQPFSTLEAMAAYHVERMCDLQPEGPITSQVIPSAVGSRLRSPSNSCQVDGRSVCSGPSTRGYSDRISMTGGIFPFIDLAIICTTG